jgi:hypothetical protein
MAIIPLLAQSSFDPEVIEKLVAAYEDAWRKIEKSGSTFCFAALPAGQEIIARIFDLG